MLDRVIRLAGLVALALIAVVIFTGTLRDRQQSADTREVACALGDFQAGFVIPYFGGARARLLARQGTPDQMPTDAQALKDLGDLLASSGRLVDRIAAVC